MKRVLACLLLAASLSACGAGTARGDLAAEVGSRRIEVDQLRRIVEKGLENAEFAAQVGGDKAEYQRQVLGQLVSSILSEEAAKRLGITVTPAQVAERRRQLEQQFEAEGTPLAQRAAAGGLSEDRIDAFIRDTVLSDAIADKLVENERLTPQQLRTLDTATVQHILVADQATANNVMAQLRAGGDFAALAKRFSTDTGSKDQGGRLPEARRGQYVAEFDKAAFEGPVGALQGPVRTRFGFHIIRVINRNIAAAGNLTPEARRTVLGPVRDTRFKEYMANLAEDLGIEINPRFGSWDPETASVVGTADDLSSPSATVAPPTQGGIPGGGAPGGGEAPGGGAPEGSSAPTASAAG